MILAPGGARLAYAEYAGVTAPATCETPLISDAAFAWPSGWFRAPTRQNAGVSPGFLPIADPAPRKPNTGLTAHSLDNTALSRPTPQSQLAAPDQRPPLEFLRGLGAPI